MFCIFEMKTEKGENKYLDSALAFLVAFLDKAKEYAFESNLVKSDCCMIELNYFYLGRVYRKKKNFTKAI